LSLLFPVVYSSSSGMLFGVFAYVKRREREEEEEEEEKREKRDETGETGETREVCEN
jgi:hypothetical protein